MENRPLFGREAELATLRKALALSMTAGGRALSVVGPPGIGKTRLVSELRPWAESHGVRWIEGRCFSPDDGATYIPFREMLSSAAGIDPLDDEEEQRTKIRELIKHTAPDRVDSLAPPLCAALSLTYPGHDAGEVTGGERTLWIREAIEDYIKLHASRQPLILVLDDLQWCDARSEELIEHLFVDIAARRVLLVCCYHPTYKPTWSMAYHRRIELQPLPAQAAEELLFDGLKDRELGSPERATVLARARGNPFYIEELTRALLAMPALEPLESQALPDSAATAVRRRLRAFAEEHPRAAELMRVAALIGPQFSAMLVGNAVEFCAEELRDQLRILVDSHIIRRLGGRVAEGADVHAFVHGLVHENALALFPEEGRKDVHGRVADAIVTLCRAHASQFPARLAYHYDRAERAEDATHWYRVAASQELQNSCFEESMRSSTRALELLAGLEPTEENLRATCELRIVSAGGHAYLGRPGDAIRIARAGLEVADQLADPKLQALAHEKLAFACDQTGDLDTSREHYREAERLFQGIGREDRAAVCRNGVLASLFNAGEYEGVCQEYETELEAMRARTANARPGAADEVSLLNNLGSALSQLGRYQDALRRFAEAQRLLADDDDSMGSAYVLANTAEALFWLGDIRGAEEKFSEAQWRFRSMGYRLLEGLLTKDVARCKLEQACYDEARRLAWESYCVSQETESEACQIDALLVESSAFLFLGVQDQALDSAKRASSRATGLESPQAFIEGAITLASAHLMGEEFDLALEVLHGALDRCRSMHSRLAEARVLTLQAEAFLGLGQSEQAIAAATGAADITRPMGTRIVEAWAALILGRIYEAAGACDEALPRFQHALGIAIDIDHCRLKCLAATGLAVCEREIGQPEQALHLLEQAAKEAERALAGCNGFRAAAVPTRDLEHIKSLRAELTGKEETCPCPPHIPNAGASGQDEPDRDPDGAPV